MAIALEPRVITVNGIKIMASDKLKTCPFCSSENVHICKENNEFVVECKDCGACGSFLMSLQQAKKRWNLAKIEKSDDE